MTLIFLTFLILWSCSDEVKFNTPGFQGNKNYKLWRATYYEAHMAADGSLTITAGNTSEDIQIIVASVVSDTIDMTVTSFSNIKFRDFENIEFSTSNEPDENVSLYPEIGKLLFTESTSEYISGTFRFIAFTADGLQSVGFNEGVFYRIPITVQF